MPNQMTLQELSAEFIAAGYNQFMIEGVNTDSSSDVHCLAFRSPNWVVFYTERGQESPPIFSSPDKNAAIEFFRAFVSKISHHHIVVFTRSKEILSQYIEILSSNGIGHFQNDIDSYSTLNDRVYRLFVINQNIFKVKKILPAVPFLDPEFKRS